MNVQMDAPDATLLAPLTPDVVQRIFPVAPRDRRENSSIFSSWISRDEMRDDTVFYEVLTKIIAGDDLDVIRSYDQKMTRLGGKYIKKAFGVRAIRYLQQAGKGDLSEETVFDFPQDYFSTPSVEAAVFAFLRQISGPKRDACDAVENNEKMIEPSWKEIAAEIADAAMALDAPDVEAAERMLELATVLRDVCESASRQDEARARLIMLAECIGFLDPDLAPLVCEAASDVAPEWLEALELAVVTAENSRSARKNAAAEVDQLRMERRAAADLEDLEAEHRLQLLLPRLRSANARLEAAERDDDDALDAVRRLLEDSADEADQEESSAEDEFGADADSGARENAIDEPEPAAGKDATNEESDGLTVDGPEPAKDDPRPKSAPAAPVGQADEPDASDQDDAPCAVGPQSVGLDDLLAHYLKGDELVFAWHLVRLSEKRGGRPAIPAPVLKALAIAPSFRRPEDMADPFRLEVLAEMMSTVQMAGAEGAADSDELTRMMAFAALLRPALFDMSNIGRGYLSSLSLDGPLTLFGRLASELSGLGYDQPISMDDLADLSGAQRKLRLPTAQAACRIWLDSARAAKTIHQPTYYILHLQMAPGGRIGKIIEDVLAGRQKANSDAQDLIDRLMGNRGAQERFVADSEKALGRPRRDRIEGTPLVWICDWLQEACEHLRDLLDAQRADAGLNNNRRRESLAARVGSLRKLLVPLLHPEQAAEGGLDGAVSGVVARTLIDLDALLAGRIPDGPAPKPRWLLETPLLRLPGGCQSYCGEEDAFVSERMAQEEHLLQALQRPTDISPQLSDAYGQRLGEHAILAATRVFDVLKAQGLPASQQDDMQQALGDALDFARGKARDRVEHLRQDLATLANLDLSTPADVRDKLERIAAIAQSLDSNSGANGVMLPALDGARRPDVPPDFPELDGGLERIEAFRDELRQRIAREQRERLEALANQPTTAGAAAEILDRLEDLDPVTIDDVIADLQAGRTALLLDENREDDFTRFFPKFVEDVDTAEELNRGRINAAITDRSRHGPLDFSHHDEHDALAAERLMEAWYKASLGLKNNSLKNLRAAIADLSGLIGFTSVSLGSDRELVSGRLRTLQLTCDIPEAGRWFLPPAFGSEARGSYPVLLANQEVTPDQLSTELGRIGREKACLLFIFGRLSRRRREELARVLRRDRQVALLIDETQILYLARSRGALMEKIFSCATPFAWTQPYTTNAGSIPPEMFFGRQEDMAKIVARASGGCLIYGGRQLGKSALLNHVRRKQHRPKHGEIAIYLEIKVIGDATTPSERLWNELAHELNKHGIIAAPAAGSKELSKELCVAIETWLNAEAHRRLLVMLDEADNFLSGEHGKGYPNLQRLKSLMEATHWRFKVVFAGLHKVRRMAQAPNSPLPHLGHPICIGPMNATPENQAEVRRLAVAPMRAAGFDYDPSSLAWDMLARVNHYPSLVQVFCKSVIETVSGHSRGTGGGPRWELGRETLFEGQAAQKIADEIRERFQLTLNLDPRYDLIAKCMALHRFDDSDGYAAVLRNGLTVQDIGELVLHWWPAGQERLRSDDLCELLEEMVDLGVLGQFSKGRFGLRNAHIAQLLGQRTEIERDILALSEREPAADYDATTFCRRVRPSDANARSPLSDRMVDRLFSPREPGIRIVVGATSVIGADIGERLATLAENWTSGDEAPEVHRHLGSPGELRAVVDRARKGRHIVFTGGAWDDAVAEWLGRQDTVKSGRTLPVWVLPPSADIVRVPEPAMEGVQVFRADPWAETMVRHWLWDQGLTSLDDRQTRAAILAVSGGAPARLSALIDLLQQLTTETPDRRLQRLSEWAGRNRLKPEDVGLPADLVPYLSDLVELGDIEDSDDLEAIASPKVAATLASLGLAMPFGHGGLRVTPLGKLVAG